MFDLETSRFIRRAPALRGVTPETLPQQLTGIYAELVALRLREGEPTSQPAGLRLLERLSRIATIYEALADTGESGEPRRAAAFVAGTAHQMLGKVLAGAYDQQLPFLSASAIQPLLAAPLLFLIIPPAQNQGVASGKGRKRSAHSFSSVQLFLLVLVLIGALIASAGLLGRHVTAIGGAAVGGDVSHSTINVNGRTEGKRP